ncbi:MAG: agmatine deiminase family protein [Bacteroidota bacterium]
MKKILLPFVFSLCLGSALAQDSTEKILPVGFSDEELMQMQERNGSPFGLLQSGYTTPPVSPVRTAAEWEEIDYLCITWTSYQSMLREIVRNAQNECTVYIICTDSNTVKSYLTSGGVPLVNLHFKQAPYNSVWIRDYGPNSAYTNDVDSLILVDWKYNRPTRTRDDTIPSVIARDLGLPVYLTTVSPNDIIHTGGNWMSDGLGTAFSSNLVLNENPSKTNAQINAIHNSFMGINTYIKMTVLPYDGINHIDMHMKLLDEETLLVGQYPTGVSDGPQIEANIQYVLSNYTSVFGTPYRIIRIPMPPEQNGTWPNQGGDYLTYVNASFVNKTIIVPQYYQQYDTTALRIWRESCPGYNVVGINSNASIAASGSLHCITHEIATSDPLLIVHQKLQNTTNTTIPYQVDARIQHRSGIASATLYYRTDTLQPYSSTSMTLTNVPNNTWTGFIPPQSAGTTVYYYISATSVSGKTQLRPIVAPAGYWKFKVLGVTEAQELLGDNGIRPIYPNPSKGITCIPVNLNKSGHMRLALYDVLGNEVALIYEGQAQTGEKNYFINTTDIASGTYVVVMQTEEEFITQKLIVR